jgi:hypothetical protein
MHKKTSKKLKNRVFTRKHYQSNDGMLTTVWGPSTWHLLHTMSFNYPVNPSCDDKNNYRDFILNLQNVLPCGKCRKNLKKNFKKLPLLLKHMACRDSFSKYIYRLHELVNKMLGKTSGLTYEDVRERYEHFRSRCAKSLEELKQEQEEAEKNLYNNPNSNKRRITKKKTNTAALNHYTVKNRNVFLILFPTMLL